MILNHPTTPSQTLQQPRCSKLPLLRRRKVQRVHLGGKRPRRRMLVLVRIFIRLRVRWLKLQYFRMQRRLKVYYRNLMKDLVEASANTETFQQCLLMESTLTFPVGVSFSSYPSSLGSDCPQTIFI